MSRYSNFSQPQHASATTSSFSATLTVEKTDERASQSGSDDGNYAVYPDTHKETDLDDDPNNSLTLQTLNADGTPKRPMNAFMIFARRRRPQVSAENQAMRTGEISKILSKEWVNMPTSEKQFYLEQAKQLKETFNSRYPDYVYRRRPNNSRKRRRADGSSARSPEQALLGEPADDAGSIDLDVSPIDGDDLVESVSPSYTRSPYPLSQSSVDHGKHGAQSRGSGHQVSLEPPFRSNTQHDVRMQYNGSGHSERAAPSSMGLNASPRMPIGHDPLGFSAYGQQSSSQSSALFNSDSLASPQGWPPRVDRLAPTWMGGGDNRQLGGQKTNGYPSSGSSNSWPSASEHHSPNSAHPSSNSYFPTLNTPFYPGQTHASPFQTNIPPSPSLHPPHASNYDQLNHMQHSSLPRDFTPRGYGSAPTLATSYPASGRDSLLYGQRNLPPVQTMTGYAQSQSPASSSAGSGNAAPPFWTRE